MRMNSRELAGIIACLRPVTGGCAMTEVQRGLLITPDGLEAAGMEAGAIYYADTGAEAPFVLPGNALELIPKLPNADVDIIDRAGKVEVKCGSIKNIFPAPMAEEYYRPQIASGEVLTRVDMETLGEAISRILYAVATSDARPALTGIHFRSLEGKLQLEALDGFRVATIRVDIPWEASMVLQASAIRKLLAFGLEGEAEIRVDGAFVTFDANERAIACRTMSDAYPNTAQLIPDNRHSAKIDRAALLEAVERCAIAIKENSKVVPPVWLQIRDRYVLVAGETSLGNYVESVPADADIPLDIAFNPRYLMDLLKHVRSDEILMRYQSAVGPCSIQEEDAFSLILPVRAI